MTIDRATIEEAYAALETLHARLAAFDYTGLSVSELLALQSRREPHCFDGKGAGKGISGQRRASPRLIAHGWARRGLFGARKTLR